MADWPHCHFRHAPISLHPPAYPLIEQSPSLCNPIANYGNITAWSTLCCMQWRCHNRRSLPAILFLNNALGPWLSFMSAIILIVLFNSIDPPAIIAARETIEDLYRTPLPSDLLPGRRGRCWQQQWFDPLSTSTRSSSAAVAAEDNPTQQPWRWWHYWGQWIKSTINKWREWEGRGGG